MHRLEPGHYVAPLLCSGSTSLPFAVGLELFSSTCQEEAGDIADAALPELPESEGLLSLQYVLDGRAQVCFSILACVIYSLHGVRRCAIPDVPFKPR